MTSPVNRAFSANVFFACHESWDAAPGFEVSAAPLALNRCRLTRDGLQFFIATMDSKLAHMNRTGGSQFAGIKMECVDADHSRVELGICLQKLPERLRRNIAAARNRDVGMPGTQLRLQPSGERGFLHAFVDLEQMRVRFADADPNDFRSSLCRKCSDTANR